MKKTLLAILPFVLLGCNVGMAPEGGSNEEIKAAFDKQPIEDRAKFLMNSPMPPADKKKRIEDMYKAEGKEMPADLAAQLSGGGGTSPGGPTAR